MNDISVNQLLDAYDLLPYKKGLTHFNRLLNNPMR